jgi:ArsR family transcriptional regulator
MRLEAVDHLHYYASMKIKKLNKYSALFKVLGDSNRLKMVEYLCGCREANVGELSNCCSIDVSVVSRHLSKLKNEGILGANKKGKEVYYDLKRSELADLLRELADEIENASCC